MINIRIERLRFLLQVLDDHSSDPEIGNCVLSRVGLTRSQMSDASLSLPDKAELLFVRFACEQLGDNSFGARAGLTFSDATTLTAYISKYSQTLRDAIEHSAKYYSLLDRNFEFDLHISSNAASIVVSFADPGVGRYHRSVEFFLFSALGRMRTVTNTAFFPLEARFPHQARDVAPEISRLAGFPVKFGAERCELIVSLSSLELPIPTYDPSLRQHLTEYGNRLRSEQKKEQSGLRGRIEGILAANLPGRIVPAEEVAASLGMSRRTFARRLSEQDLSYREVVDDLRCDLARTYLRDGFHIGEISFYLDYADQAAFSTAFKRWTGESPSAYRARR